jgi:hypothetical protein
MRSVVESIPISYLKPMKFSTSMTNCFRHYNIDTVVHNEDLFFELSTKIIVSPAAKMSHKKSTRVVLTTVRVP